MQSSDSCQSYGSLPKSKHKNQNNWVGPDLKYSHDGCRKSIKVCRSVVFKDEPALKEEDREDVELSQDFKWLFLPRQRNQLLNCPFLGNRRGTSSKVCFLFCIPVARQCPSLCTAFIEVTVSQKWSFIRGNIAAQQLRLDVWQNLLGKDWALSGCFYIATGDENVLCNIKCHKEKVMMTQIKQSVVLHPLWLHWLPMSIIVYDEIWQTGSSSSWYCTCHRIAACPAEQRPGWRGRGGRWGWWWTS